MSAHVVLMAFVAVLVSSQMPVSPPAGEHKPAAITGRVVDAATGVPIERAVVLFRRPPKFAGIQAVTDRDGRFAFGDLTSGAFDISAAAGEFSASHAPYRSYGYGRPEQPLKPGEVREITIELQRAVVIAGRILDESGGPMSGVSVQARDLSTGFEHHSDFRRRTDDLGAFRLFGLPPGRYIVCATVHEGVIVDAGVTSKTAGSRLRFVETCYPSATNEAEAIPVPVASGQEIDSLEIRMQRRATFSITGTIIDSTGRPADSVQLWLSHVKGDGASGSGQRVERGRFTISDVVPGRYRLRAEIGPPPAPNSPPPTEAGMVDLGFVSEQVEGIVITMKKSVSQRGFVTFEDRSPPEVQNLKLRVELQRTGQGWPFGRPSAEVRSDLAFDLKDLLGPYVLTVAGLPAGSAVKSIRYRGRDIAHVPTEFDGDPQNFVEIVVTRRTAELTGRALDTTGSPAAAARVYIFPTASARWKGWSRGAARTAENGSFRIRSLLSGDYFAVAISDQDFKEVQGAEWYRPNPYERFATIAERVSLLESDRRVMDLRVTPIPQAWKR